MESTRLYLTFTSIKLLYMNLGFYLSNVGQSCNDVCDSLGDEFSCMRLLQIYDQTEPFIEAIDAGDYRQLAGVRCSTNESTDLYEENIHPSFDVTKQQCEGYKNVTFMNCDARADSNVRRLCKCIDKGIRNLMVGCFNLQFYNNL